MLAFHKATNRRNILVDRGVISFRAYRDVFQRNLDETYDDDENSLLFNSLSVYLHAPADIIKQRFIDCNEPPLPFNTTIEQHLATHWLQYIAYKGEKIQFDTHKYTIDECVDGIINAIDDLNAIKGNHEFSR